MRTITSFGEAERRVAQHALDDVLVGHKARRPELLLSLERHCKPVRLFFDGLEALYFECLTSGRLDDWKKAAHSAIDLVCTGAEAKLVKRGDLDAILAAEEEEEEQRRAPVDA